MGGQFHNVAGQLEDIFKLLETMQVHRSKPMTQYETVLSDMEALEVEARRTKALAVGVADRDMVVQMRAKLEAYKEIRNVVAALQQKERERNDAKYQDSLQRQAGCNEH